MLMRAGAGYGLLPVVCVDVLCGCGPKPPCRQAASCWYLVRAIADGVGAIGRGGEQGRGCRLLVSAGIRREFPHVVPGRMETSLVNQDESYVM